MSAEDAFELLELRRDASLSEQDEILTFAPRIGDRHPFGCTDEDMEEIGTLVERIRARRAATRYARREDLPSQPEDLPSQPEDLPGRASGSPP